MNQKSLYDFGFPESFDRTNKSDVFYFLTKINKFKSGYLVSESISNQVSKITGGFPKYFPELYTEFKSTVFPAESDNWRFCQKLWHFLQDDFDLNLGKCNQCGKRCTMESFVEGYKKYCSTKCVNQSNEHKKKSETSKEIKYGSKTYNNRNAAKQTCIKKYGVSNYSQTNEWKKYAIEINDLRKEHEIETKRKNHTFGTSKIEEDCYIWLKSIYPNVKRQHKDNFYPFACDFYIPEYKLYIEIQGSWTHGRHPFDKSNINDLNKVQKWKNKNTQFYDEAIYNWTIRDVKKRTIAKENGLNYLEVFETNLDKCKDTINTYIIKNIICLK